MSKKSKAVPAPAPALPIPTDTKPTVLKVRSIPLAQIHVAGKDDRTKDAAYQESIRELAKSMAGGLIQPITIWYPGSEADARADTKLTFRLVAGERRLDAARLLGWEEISASVLYGESAVREIRATENLQRMDLNDDQKAFVIGDLVEAAEVKIAGQQGVTNASDLLKLSAPARDAVRKAAIAKVAERFGKKLQWVRDYAYVGGLPKRVRELAAAGRLSLSHLKVLAAVVDPEHCTDLAIEAASGEGAEAAYVPMVELAELQRRVNASLNSLAKVPWDLTIEFAGKPACQGCDFNSRNRTGLFDGRGKESGARGDRGVTTDINFATDAEAEGVCLNMACFRVKADACKTAMRNAGNRIAGAAAEAKPKERGAVVGKLVNEANRKHHFVKPTVFRKEVQDRVDSKLEKPKGKASTSGTGIQKRTSEEDVKRQAGYKLRDAIEARNGKLIDQWVRYVQKLPLTDQALLLLAAETIPADGCLGGNTPKEAKHTDAYIALIDAALDRGSITAFDTIVNHLPVNIGAQISDWRQRTNVKLIDHLARKAGVKEFPPVPVLEDFLPKPAAEKSKMSPAPKPAAKKPSGKKKAKKKTKMSDDAPPLGPSAATVDSVMNDRDDRGRADRAKVKAAAATAADDGEEGED